MVRRSHQAPRPIYLTLACNGQRLDERKVLQLLNIEEDSQGRDLVTFVCPQCKHTHKSLRR